MFDAPPSTLYNSLNNVLENPKEYLADICFAFPSNEVWAHRAIILARAPKEFVERYLPELYQEHELPLKLDISQIIRQELFTPLLRFWYTASYVHLTVSPQSSISDLSVMTPTNTSPTLGFQKDNGPTTPLTFPPTRNHIQHELEQLGIQLGTAVLPPHCDSVPDFVQLVSDLRRMRDEKLAVDVTIDLISSKSNDVNDQIPSLLSTSPENHTQQVNVPVASFKAHRFLLAAQSPYFYALFCAPFREASSAVVHLTDDLFNDAIVDLVLNFFYLDKVVVTPLAQDTTKTSSHLQRRLQHNKHALRVMQKAFYAADYLGHSETLGQAILHEMEQLCHHFKCVCAECAVLLPSMLAWSDKHVEVVSKLRRALILLYCDPVHSLSSIWSQRPFAFLISSIVPSTFHLGEDTLAAVLKQEPLFRARPPKTLVHEIEERTFYNVTKHNAIHVLHSLHLCLSQLRSADPNPSWSRPTLDLVNPILRYTVSMISQFFDFYCVEYPILLSCVDGIGAGFSVDFLEFLLFNVLTDGIQENNAGVIYQGIWRDLVGRQEVVQNVAIDDVLIKARIRCAAYISKHWTKMKATSGFRTLDKATMRQLAEDINIPYRSLTKPFDTDFSNIFSFKPRKSKKQQPMDKNASLTAAYTRRLSLGNLITRGDSHPSRSRPRALSTESVLVPTRPYPSSETTRTNKNQPLLNLLSYETQERSRRLVEANHESPMLSLSRSISVDNNLGQQMEQHLACASLSEAKRPMLRTSSSFTSLTDQLLPVDTAMDPPLPQKTKTDTQETRPTRLKFELPATPARSKSPSAPQLNVQYNTTTYLLPQPANRYQKQRKNNKLRKSRWSIGTNSDVSDEEEPPIIPILGDKVELLRRPLPTMGTIRYIGPVQFAEGQYIGVELESRLGKSDGSVDGVRYFHTDPQRALFVKPDDFKIIQSNNHYTNYQR
ncbi:uncharacterized protein B0P05DRAFT_545469 [Gilbertella persicaria]|uniref:uncharacterized protein n=1 Tax=Gilbertella persicaria TaxID=101096 RepID=UPI00221E39B2|nr:uncharacterized protein B0P05DRAFT_545469 [Gilbertella persicaria]KAI8076690.1 hypothetical protein B0P05DRAFT_545469 [Gilbertella persicaria]